MKIQFLFFLASLVVCTSNRNTLVFSKLNANEKTFLELTFRERRINKLGYILNELPLTIQISQPQIEQRLDAELDRIQEKFLNALLIQREITNLSLLE